jgi:hypothetical protein
MPLMECVRQTDPEAVRDVAYASVDAIADAFALALARRMSCRVSPSCWKTEEATSSPEERVQYACSVLDLDFETTWTMLHGRELDKRLPEHGAFTTLEERIEASAACMPADETHRAILDGRTALAHEVRPHAAWRAHIVGYAFRGGVARRALADRMRASLASSDSSLRRALDAYDWHAALRTLPVFSDREFLAHLAAF